MELCCPSMALSKSIFHIDLLHVPSFYIPFPDVAHFSDVPVFHMVNSSLTNKLTESDTILRLDLSCHTNICLTATFTHFSQTCVQSLLCSTKHSTTLYLLHFLNISCVVLNQTIKQRIQNSGSNHLPWPTFQAKLLHISCRTKQSSKEFAYPFPPYLSLCPSPPLSSTHLHTKQRHGLHPVHHPADSQDSLLLVVVEEDAAAGGAGGRRRAEDAAAERGRRAAAGVAAAVAVERGGAGEPEREGGADVLLQVREQGRGGRRHLRQPGQGRLRPRRRGAVLQLHGYARRGGHLRQDGGAAEPEHPPGGHPAYAGRLRGRQAQDRGAAQGRRKPRRQGRRREDGAGPGQRRDQGVHRRLRAQEGLITRRSHRRLRGEEGLIISRSIVPCWNSLW